MAGDLSGLLLVSDMDGTALVAQQGIPPQNIEAARAFTRRGGRFTFASGRAMGMMRLVHPLFPVNAPMVALNGSLVLSPDGERILRDHPMPPSCLEMARQVADHFEGRAGVLAVGREQYYVISQEERSREICSRNTMANPRVAALAEIAEPLYKVAVMFTSQQETDAGRRWLRETFSRDYAVAVSGPCFIEVMERGVSKERGLREVCELVGMDLEQVIFLGDNENDLELLRAAGRSAAPADAAPAALAAAGETLCPCMDGALAQMIGRLMEERVPGAAGMK